MRATELVMCGRDSVLAGDMGDGGKPGHDGDWVLALGADLVDQLTRGRVRIGPDGQPRRGVGRPLLPLEGAEQVDDRGGVPGCGIGPQQHLNACVFD